MQHRLGQRMRVMDTHCADQVVPDVGLTHRREPPGEMIKGRTREGWGQWDNDTRAGLTRRLGWPAISARASHLTLSPLLFFVLLLPYFTLCCTRHTSTVKKLSFYCLLQYNISILTTLLVDILSSYVKGSLVMLR